MIANLNRQKFIDLLNKLGDPNDDEVIAAARDLHAQVVVSGLTWDDLLFPEEEEEKEEEEEEEKEEEAEEEEAEEEEEEAEEEEGEEKKEEKEEPPLSEEEEKEALSLINQISELGVSAETKKELEEYKIDIKEGEFEKMDLKYLQALHKRLAK